MNEVSQITLPSLNFFDLLLMIGLILTLFFSAKTIIARQAKTERFVIRLTLIAHLVIFLGLLGMIIKPTFNHDLDATVTLITDSASEQWTSNAYGRSNYRFTTTEPVGEQSRAYPITSLQSLLSEEVHLTKLKVYGDGLTTGHWQELTSRLSAAQKKQLRIEFSPSPTILGFERINFSPHAMLGDYWHITGQVSLAASNAPIYQVNLLDPSGSLISSSLLKAGERFHFASRPKLKGAHVYQLQLLSRQGEVLANEAVAVYVESWHDQALPLSLATWLSAPSFEAKQLQDWLKSYPLMSHQKIRLTKDKWLNQLSVADKLSEDLIANQSLAMATIGDYDLLIIDSRSLIELAEHEQQHLFKSVQAGLGLLILGDASLPKLIETTPWLRAFSIDDLALAEPSTMVWLDNALGWTGALDMPLPRDPFKFTAPTGPLNVLVRTGEHEAMVVRQSVALGEIAVSLVNATNQWATRGQGDIFSHYWQNLIYNLAKPSSRSKIFVADSAIARAMEKTKLCVETSGTPIYFNIVQASGGKPNQSSRFTLPLSADPQRPHRYCGVFWPEQSGWYELALVGLKEQVIVTAKQYIYAPSDWAREHQRQKQQATLMVARTYQHKVDESVSIAQAVSLWWFWTMLLSGLAWLWFEHRMLRTQA